MLETSSPENIGNINRSAIVKILKRKGPMTRSEISKELNLSFPAVSSNVKVLLDNNYIIYSDDFSHPTGMGRPSIMLEYNAKRAYVVGVCSDIRRIRAVCADMIGNTVSSIEYENNLKMGGEHMYDLMRDSIQSVLDMAGVSYDNLECICVGIPGVFDEKLQKYRLVPFVTGWEDIGLSERIRNKFHTRVIEDNVVNLGTLGEYKHGVSQKCRNSVLIDFNIGIGAGIIINGELYHGFNNAAGEIGYMMMDKYHLRYGFKNEGILEEILSGMNSGMPFESMEELIGNAKSGNINATQWLEEITVYFSMLLANISIVLNPEMIVFTGISAKTLYEYKKEYIMSILKAHIPYVPEIHLSKLGQDASIVGAVEMALNKVEEDTIY